MSALARPSSARLPLTLGRQYDSLVDFVAPLSGTAGTFGDTGFAHPYDNDNLNHSVRMNNADQVNLQRVYLLSKRTDVYVEGMYQHAIGHNSVAFINTSGGASSTANQVVAMVGMPTRF